ncbi:hypothetical protein LMH87_004276 [Akanthomyces muscarius]|uniref:Uncharacterized protein n=1 Tax=Akanthomyces muscarius TaxID=2231603 RepID=A0A9W8UHX3_AKAMU|nr:hypothetical protein LMH87_004276 [Akanthomyces muscarius]KAJ4145424.1 hypothetical protein LMH87_004276 [Akanthomyces muscarius]
MFSHGRPEPCHCSTHYFNSSATSRPPKRTLSPKYDMSPTLAATRSENVGGWLTGYRSCSEPGSWRRVSSQ